MIRFFEDLKKYRGYMFYSAKAQLKSELANSWLGGLWWVLEPTLNMLVYMFVYTVVFRRTTTYVVAFIVVGLTYWRFFNTTVISSITLVRRHRSVISKTYIPKFILLGSSVLVNGFKLLCSYVPLICLMVYYQIPLNVYMLGILPITAVLFLLTFGISSLFMHMGVYLEDLQKLMKVFLQMVFYISGVFYPINEMLEGALARSIFVFNPMALIIYEARNALLYAQSSEWTILGLWALVAVLLSVLGVSMIYKSESRYIKVL